MEKDHRFEREKERKVAAYRRALLRKESEIYEWGRRIRELEARLSDEAERLQSSSLQFSDLLKVRQASMALKDSGKILSISRLCCVLRGVYMKNYVFLLVIVPTFVLAVIFTVRKFLTFPGHYGNPNHHHSTKAIPHYYHENASMETLCKLHGWGFVNILDGRVYDPVLFSNELELLAIRWRELYPYVTQCVILESTRRLQGCLSLLYLQSIGMFGFVEPRYTVNLLRWCDEIPQSFRAHYRQSDDILADSGWHCNFCYSRYDRLRVYIQGDNPELGPIAHSFSAVHLPLYLLDNACLS
ncbi:hypothetical protein ARALYDRAFT_347008 [Arabidopsis lyrata subsp. lyrata]|uniref:Uncharacterized protein n=1 Tax=Arabidopsis lyrata subsp. lyrata TaxID=81972 RepID=D7LR57_ARALL|nr:hypothetical protein ARALYDRAFT_347008 [Arabidopsis lyrata subsp. lyrata]